MSLTLLSSIALIALACGWNLAIFARKHFASTNDHKKMVNGTIIDKKAFYGLNKGD